MWRIGALGLLCVWQLYLVPMAAANAVFEVQHRFKGKERSLSDFRTHDDIRHGRILDEMDIPLGGNGNPTGSGLYFTQIKLGNPAHPYHVQVDTGSDILWVNCVGCENCPEKSDLGLELQSFDPKASNTSKAVTCDADGCSMIYARSVSGCVPKTLCYYQVTYGDGSRSSGFFLEDAIHYSQGQEGDSKATEGSGNIVFGCGSKQEGQLTASGEAVDGIMGFGQAQSSVLSQLAAAKKTKKMFSHCLDSNKGGGIFAIGEVVEPKLNTTPLIPAQAHYNVVVKSVEVDGGAIELPELAQSAIIDSGTTLAYLPDDVYEMLMKSIHKKQPKISLYTVDDQFKCFEFHEDVDKGLPTVKFHFTESLIFTVYPHEYLFPIREDSWCIGWQSGGQSASGNKILLGDMVLSNKLVLYDLENQALGWTEYNCSTSIKVRDSDSEAPSSIPFHNISSAYHSVPGFVFVLITALISIATMF